MNEAESCRAYVEHLHHEHHRLNQLLIGIGHKVAALDQAGRSTLVDLSQLLAELHSELKAHFTEEETGGCLEEAVVRCPSVTDESRAILAEHAVLDRMLEQLITQSRSPSVIPAEMARNYRAFAEKLQAHDAAETRILQMAFGAEAADYDVEGED